MSGEYLPAPIALFVYCRPQHTRETIKALQRNTLASESDLFIFSDAAHTAEKISSVSEVRNYIRGVGGFKSVTVHERQHNFGLAHSIIDGVTRLCRDRSHVVVLEDDMVTSPFFLTFMNEGLECYATEVKVASIHGYNYPVASSVPETFFICGADCWGWATWQRAWKYFNPDGQLLLDDLLRRDLTREFDFNESYPYTEMLRDQIAGRNDSWAIRWYASAFLQDMLTLYPGRSLVQNIGTDGSGIHCGVTTAMGVSLNNNKINVEKLPVKENYLVKKEMETYFNRLRGSASLDVKQRLRRIIKGFFAR